MNQLQYLIVWSISNSFVMEWVESILWIIKFLLTMVEGLIRSLALILMPDGIIWVLLVECYYFFLEFLRIDS
jgi:hypothetical protein